MSLVSCQEAKKIQLKPTDILVEASVKKLDGVTNTCIVTTENDKSGLLNTTGNFTGAVYFRLNQVDKNMEERVYHKPLSEDACEALVLGGGKIEIFASAEDAIKRDEQLATYDSKMDVGYHSVRDTIVIRFSRELSLIQQQALEEQFYSIFLETLH